MKCITMMKILNYKKVLNLFGETPIIVMRNENEKT